MAQNIYDRPEFFEGYSRLGRSVDGLDGAPEWPALRAMLPDVDGLRVVDLGCGFGWFCRWARAHGASEVLGLDLSEKMLARARAAGADDAITYRRANDVGTRDDVLFVYDLEMPADVTPKNTDGEIVSFALRSAADVVDEVRRTDDYKFNVNLVLIDFALRHGLVSSRDPEYLDLVTGLRRPLD